MAAVAVVIAAIVTLLVWIMTPERLTPLIEEVASGYFTADVRLDRAELTFWSTFPHLEVDVENLRVTSHSLDTLTPQQRATLPANADSLLRVDSFHGGVNILHLLHGKIALYDLEINRPQVNLVAWNDSVANYNIVPPSPEETPDTAAIELPAIAINSFVIRGEAPIRYYSAADSLNIGVTLSATTIEGTDEPGYRVTVDGDVDATVEPYLSMLRLPVMLNGDIGWTPDAPLNIALSDFRAGIGPVRTVVNTAIDMTDELVIGQFEMVVERFKIIDLINAMPAEYRAMCRGLVTDLQMGASVKFTRPYVPAAVAVPTAVIDFDIPQGTARYEQLTLSRAALKGRVELNGSDFDKAVVTLRRFMAVGEGVGFEVSGTATNLVTDPRADGNFKGGVSFAHLPSRLLSALPVTVRGELRGDFDFRVAMSDLTPTTFHRMLLNGDATLSDLVVTEPSQGLRLYSRLMEMKLGTGETFIHNDLRSDSLLTISFKCDTVSMETPDMAFEGSSMLLAAGARNTVETLDTTRVTPLGAVFKAAAMKFESFADSSRIRVRDIMCHASLQRYSDNARQPLLSFNFDAGRLRYVDPLTRVSFRDTRLDASCHPRLKPQMSARMSQAFDSIRERYPHLRADSVYRMARAEMRARRAARGPRTSRNDGTERIDYGLDDESKQLLRWIDFEGHLTSKRARVFTPYFPVRNRLSDIDVSITPDSLNIRNTRYEMGRSDFVINGSVSNISRALTSRRSPMRINFDVQSDTIDINEITQAALAGSAFAERVAAGAHVALADSDSDDMLQLAVQQQAPVDSMAPILIPMNVDANLMLHSRNIIYSDLMFTDFHGEALVHDGALSLHELGATTDAGKISLTALYTAPTKNDLSFAFGMKVTDFHLEKFIKLVPAVDSIMPLLNDIKGVVNAEMAATSRVDSGMNLVIPSLSAALTISGDSLVLIDAETFRSIGKWLLFKNKDKNVVDHMEVQVVIENSVLELFPFMFTIDRYKLGVMGSNDLALNYNYHVSVLKSPIPFKFGINIKGNPDKMKIRLGRAKFKESMAGERIAIVDTTRINLINQIENVFRRGVSNARVGSLKTRRPSAVDMGGDENADTISHADSLLFIREGLLPAPPAPAATAPVDEGKNNKRKKKK